MVNAAFSRLTGSRRRGSDRPHRDRARPLARPERPRPAARRDRPRAAASTTCRRRIAHPRRQRSPRCSSRRRASRWTGATTSSSTPATSPPRERTRLEHAAILERASIGIALTRDRRFVQANPRFEAIFGWAAGGLPASPARWSGSTTPTTPRSASSPGRCSPPASRSRPSARCERHDGSRFWCRLLGQAVDPTRPGDGGTIWIADDVTERHRLDAALAAARDAAEAASRAKSAFLANTSHEIRTPLNGLLGLARLALRGDHRRRRRAATTSSRSSTSAQGLEGILSDILDFSKIEAGKFTLEQQRLRPARAAGGGARVLPAARRGQGPDARARGRRRRCAAVVTGDPVRVRQILGNFITNAVKFTDRGRRAHRGRARAAGGVRLAVADTGGGVDAERVPRLFQPFSPGRRVDDAALSAAPAWACRSAASSRG